MNLLVDTKPGFRITTVFILTLILNACGGGGSSAPVDPTIRAKGQSVVTTVDVAVTVTLGGSVGESSPLDFTVTTNPVNGVLTGIAPDLTYTPNSLFTGSDSFDFITSDLVTTSTPIKVHIQVVEGVIHVATTGNDANSGSATSPKLTIQAGIDQANADFSSSVVKVAAGTYVIDSNVAGPGDNAIVLADGVSVFGGYSVTNWRYNDPAVQLTVINDINVDNTGSNSFNNINRTIHAIAGITNATIVAGFTIQSGDADMITVFLLQSGSPTIRNNIILAGTNPTVSGALENSNGLLLSASTAVITDNLIDGGDGGQFSRGINNSGSSPSIQRNSIAGGDAFSQTVGILNSSGSSPLIANNTIHGGQAVGNSSGVGSTLSSNPTIVNNTIYGRSLGIYMFTSNPDIRNNIVYSDGTCIREENDLANPVMMRNNNLFGCSVLYRDDGLTNITDVTTIITTGEGSDTLANYDNDSLDPLFADFDGADNDLETISDNDWHLTDTSPASVTTGGLDLSILTTIDKDNVPRTDDGAGTGWSMGAYEK